MQRLGGGSEKQHAAEGHNAGSRPSLRPGPTARDHAIVAVLDQHWRRSGSAKKRSGWAVSSAADLTTSRQYDLRNGNVGRLPKRLLPSATTCDSAAGDALAAVPPADAAVERCRTHKRLPQEAHDLGGIGKLVASYRERHLGDGPKYPNKLQILLRMTQFPFARRV